MTTLRYTPGEWRAIVAPSGLALLPASVEGSTLDRLWTGLSEGAGLGAVLESLSGAFGTSLSSIPPFAVATLSGGAGDSDASGASGDAGGSVRLAVRGGLAIEVTDASGSYMVSGADVTTWSERVVTGGVRLRVRPERAEAPEPASTTGADADASAAAWFPIASGVVLCAAVDVQLTAAGAAPAKPASAEPAPAGPAPTAAATSPAAESTGTEAEGADVEQTVIPETTLLTEPPADAPAEAPDAGPAATAAADAPDSAAEPDSASEPTAADEAPTADEQASAELDELAHTRTELPDDAYDHLWGATVVKSVEEAAVREVDDDEEEAAVTPAASPVVTPAPSTEEAADPHDAASEPAPSAAGFAPAPTAPAPPAPPVSGGLIDGVPDFGGLGAASGSSSINGRTVPPMAPAPAAAPTPAAAAASSPATAASAVGPAATGTDFDHDGLTVTVSELEAMRRLGGASGTDPAAGAQAATPAGGLGRIVLSTGETHTLDRPIIIGRRPRANRVQADQVPVLVTVASPEQDISRNHLEIRIEGRHVLVVDLDTTNGSVLHRDGTPPLRLGPHEPVLVLSDDVVDLGDGVTVAFEDVP